MDQPRPFRITFAASRPDVLVVEEVPRGQVIPEPELTDAEADAALAVLSPAEASDRRRRARAAASDDDVLQAIFGDTWVTTPAEARALYGGG